MRRRARTLALAAWLLNLLFAACGDCPRTRFHPEARGVVLTDSEIWALWAERDESPEGQGRHRGFVTVFDKGSGERLDQIKLERSASSLHAGSRSMLALLPSSKQPRTNQFVPDTLDEDDLPGVPQVPTAVQLLAGDIPEEPVEISLAALMSQAAFDGQQYQIAWLENVGGGYRGLCLKSRSISEDGRLGDPIEWSCDINAPNRDRGRPYVSLRFFAFDGRSIALVSSVTCPTEVSCTTDLWEGEAMVFAFDGQTATQSVTLPLGKRFNDALLATDPDQGASLFIGYNGSNTGTRVTTLDARDLGVPPQFTDLPLDAWLVGSGPDHVLMGASAESGGSQYFYVRPDLSFEEARLPAPSTAIMRGRDGTWAGLEDRNGSELVLQVVDEDGRDTSISLATPHGTYDDPYACQSTR